MTIRREPKHIAAHMMQRLAKRQPRRPKPAKEFPQAVKDIIAERSGGQCEIGDCTAAAVHCHHRRPRLIGGSSEPWVNRAANGLHVCLYHHGFIESHRTLAMVEGWLISQFRKDVLAVDVPVLRRGKSVLLSDDGGIRSAGGAA